MKQETIFRQDGRSPRSHVGSICELRPAGSDPKRPDAPINAHSSTTTPNRESAARKLYDAEVALHIARQSGVDKWVKAAAERLHQAILAYQSDLSAPTYLSAELSGIAQE